jgi:hypothetical protein
MPADGLVAAHLSGDDFGMSRLKGSRSKPSRSRPAEECVLLSQIGQPRSFGDICLISPLPLKVPDG